MSNAASETLTPNVGTLSAYGSTPRRRHHSSSKTRRRSESDDRLHAHRASPSRRSRDEKKVTVRESDRADRIRRDPSQRRRKPHRPTPQVTYETPISDATDDWKFPWEKAFVYLGYAVGAGVTTVFTLDLLTGFPFIRASILFDVTYAVCGLALGYLSWNAHRDLR